ncbi:MAG: hypothetical protein IKU80_00360 [Firmicutes bacterium]|nr:hypothetical protein [Bacillota bacterium]
MDIMDKIEDIVETIMKDKSLLAKFEKDPVAVIEKLVGMDLPDAQVEKLIKAIKTKIGAEKLGDALGGLGKLFGK